MSDNLNLNLTISQAPEYGYNLKDVGSKPEKKMVTSENMLLKVKKKWYSSNNISFYEKSY